MGTFDFKTDGYIEIQVHNTFVGERMFSSYQYEWCGGDRAFISAKYLEGIPPWEEGGPWILEGSVVRLGLFLRLRVIQYKPWRNGYIVMRDGWKSRVFFRWHKWGWRVELFYHRLILAAAVFNLAYCPPGEIPSWRQLRWFKDRNE